MTFNVSELESELPVLDELSSDEEERSVGETLEASCVAPVNSRFDRDRTELKADVVNPVVLTSLGPRGYRERSEEESASKNERERTARTDER